MTHLSILKGNALPLSLGAHLLLLVMAWPASEHASAPSRPLPVLSLQLAFQPASRISAQPAPLPAQKASKAPSAREAGTQARTRFMAGTLSVTAVTSENVESKQAPDRQSGDLPYAPPQGDSKETAPPEDTSPVALAFAPSPPYPALLRDENITGIVWVWVRVEVDGSVSEIRLDKSSGYRLLDEAALHAVNGWRFQAAVRKGLRIASVARIPVRFRLDDG
jgi:protein TonB